MNKDIYKCVTEEILSIPELLNKLNQYLIGKSLYGLPLRTRSKVIKTLICNALDYDVPKRFSKTKPKFPCQNFDVYVQKSNNLQIWNDEISLERRYVLIALNENDTIYKIKIIDGSELVVLDTTGKLTTKYQAQVPEVIVKNETEDSDELVFVEDKNAYLNIRSESPISNPNNSTFLSISALYYKLQTLKGKIIYNKSLIQERTRADEAHKLVCETLGYPTFHDDGQFPDIKNQLLEVKFQMSPTIDLGLHKPDSPLKIGINFNDVQITVSMCRYLIITAHRNNDESIVIDDIIIASGKHFFDIFSLFGGKVQNAKLQIPLPSNFFD
jgi:hypothetical protein